MNRLRLATDPEMNEEVERLMQQLDVTRKGAERIANIVEAGADILRREGFTALTKRRIAKRLGISDGNVSYYFPTRESLWKGVIEHELKSCYDKHFGDYRVPGSNPAQRLEDVVRQWFREYEDRNLRVFFSQLQAFAEVSDFVAEQRNEIFRLFFDEIADCVHELNPGLSEDVVKTRAVLVMALLEGLHAVTASNPDLLSPAAGFQQQLIAQALAMARGDDERR